MNAADWKDIAMIVLGALGALLTGITSMVWTKIGKLEDSTDERFDKIPETYQRKDDTNKLEDRLIKRMDEIVAMLNQLLSRVH